MKTHLRLLLPLILALPVAASAQNPNTTTPAAQGTGDSVVDGWRGYLSIDYYGNKFIIPYARIVSISQAEYLVDGGGKVIELTIDTTGQATGRFYFLDTVLADTPLNAGQIVNNRVKGIQNRVGDKTGIDTRAVVKHYPDTTHAKTIEFNVRAKGHLKVLLDHITHEWIEEGGRGDGRTLRFE
ncbi:MAG: hypothetical protein ACI8UO_003649 [Verrucomicrobiales bacterium]|jgi:hypothetical protein